MTTIVSDTSPINYLVLIGAIDVLPQLFGEVLIPPAVWIELQHPKTPKKVFEWAASLPAWAKVTAPQQVDTSIGLGAGEMEAIALALERQIPALLMDDRQAWLAAQARSIVPVGTLTVLELAAERGLIDAEQALTSLRATNFRVEQTIIDEAIERARQRAQSRDPQSGLSKGKAILPRFDP